MMPTFSVRSRSILETCDLQLQTLFTEVIFTFDCIIVCGHRPGYIQDDLFRRGLSKLEWPNSKHNKEPSLAVDVYPYPINWQDRERMTYFAGFVMGKAQTMGYKLRWGGDWNKDWQVRDNVFDDLGHFELIG
ncbi:hypothetical protein LCGC14_1903280 [marine sediment metagenome]|uniref:Peptidase M15C domain-containing protein n=1 Tax=marine sediment metagenome TaxID=412755 RepID=A0A0F9FW80_9ZZZZ